MKLFKEVISVVLPMAARHITF